MANIKIQYKQLIILGDKNVGKSSLLMQFLNKQFDENIPPTSENMIFGTSAGIESKNILFQIIDYGSNQNKKKNEKKIMESIDGALIVYDVTNRQSYDSIQKWFTFISEYKYIPFIIVANKTDADPSLIKVTKEEACQLAEYFDSTFFECSAKTGKNVSGCFLEIFDQTANVILKRGDFSGDIDKEESEAKKNYIKKVQKYYKTKSDVIKCENCYRIPFSQYILYKNEIKVRCPCDNKIKNYTEVEVTNCCDCKKQLDFKNFKDIYYSLKEKKALCKGCSKKHKPKENEKDIIDFTLLDCLCIKHDKLYEYYCKICDKFMCFHCALKDKHVMDISKIDGVFIKEYIESKKKLLLEEEEREKKLDESFENLLATFKKVYDRYKSIKKNELNYKREMIETFSNLNYNYNLFKTLENLTFDVQSKKFDYDEKETLTDKIKCILNYINKPIEYKNFIPKKNNIIKEQFKIINNNNTHGINELVTGACELNENSFCVCFNNSYLHLYNTKNLKEPIIAFKLFEDYQGINSMLKLKSNIYFNNIDEDINNILLLAGYEKIKIIGVNTKENTIKDLGEIIEPEAVISHLSQFNNDGNIIYITNSNNFYIYNIKTKEKEDIYIKIFGEKNQDIISVKKIFNENYLIESAQDITSNYILRQDTLLLDTTMKQQGKIISEICQIDNNKNLVTKYKLEENYKLISYVNRCNIILFKQNSKDNTLVLFDVKNKKETKPLKKMNVVIDEVFFVEIKRTNNYIYFISLDTNNGLSEYIYKINEEKIENIIYINPDIGSIRNDLVSEYKIIATVNMRNITLIIFDFGLFLSVFFSG